MISHKSTEKKKPSHTHTHKKKEKNFRKNIAAITKNQQNGKDIDKIQLYSLEEDERKKNVKY